MLTLSDVQADLGIARVSTYCATSPEFIDLVNAAQRRLMRKGDWVGTAVPIYVCIFNGCVVWPRYVQSVRKINMCNRPMQVQNLWYRFMEGVCTGWGNWLHQAGGFGNWTPCGNFGPGFLGQMGKTSVYQDIQGDGRLIRYYPRCPQDIGKTITIFGIDNNNQPLQTNNGNGTYSMGIVITAANPFGSSNTFVRHIDYVLRDQTQCPTNLYAYNATTNLLEDLAQYDPSETRPSYERTRIHTWIPDVQNGQSCPKGLLALVKLKYYPAQFPTDLIFVDNLDALKLMIQSIKIGETPGGLGESKQLETAAIQELNRELENESPDDQFSAIDGTFGGATFQNACF